MSRRFKIILNRFNRLREFESNFFIWIEFTQNSIQNWIEFLHLNRIYPKFDSKIESNQCDWLNRWFIIWIMSHELQNILNRPSSSSSCYPAEKEVPFVVLSIIAFSNPTSVSAELPTIPRDRGINAMLVTEVPTHPLTSQTERAWLGAKK